jgi:hypothetical protein
LIARRAIITLAVVAAFAASPNSIPRATVAPGGGIDVLLPRTIVMGEEVRKQLKSGLTTAFIATFDDEGRNGERIRGGVRVEVRYELWDENYLLTILNGDGRRQKLTVASYDRLVEWWSKTPFRLSKTPIADAPSTVHLKVEVLPFSAGEQADAQKWLAQSIGASPRPNERPTSSSGDRGASVGNLIDVIIGTSMQRRPIQTFKWAIPVDVERR